MQDICPTVGKALLTNLNNVLRTSHIENIYLRTTQINSLITSGWIKNNIVVITTFINKEEASDSKILISLISLMNQWLKHVTCYFCKMVGEGKGY